MFWGLCWAVFFLLPVSSWSQLDSLSNKKTVTGCEANLAIATGEFNAGRFSSLPSILQGCLEKGFTKEQQIRAYILLCQVHLINDNPAEAERSYLKLLQADPEYIASPESDPVEIVYLSRKFTSRPVFTPHFRIGINTSFVSVIHEVSTYSKPDSVSTSYLLKPGWSLGGGLDWNASDRVSVSADLILSTRSFKKISEGIFNLDRAENQTFLTWVDLPLYIKYQDHVGKFRPYGYAGYVVHFRVSSKAQLTYLNIESPATVGGQGTQLPTEGTAVSLNHSQFFMNNSLLLGGGMKYKVGKNYLFADMCFQIGLTNVTIPSKNIGSPPDLPYGSVTYYNSINDLYRVNSLTLSFGYILPVYKPRKIGGWEPQGLLGKILYGNKPITK